MKRVAFLVTVCVLVAAPAWGQTKPQASKQREVLALYDRFLAVEQRLELLETRMKEVEKDVEPFLQSESPLTRVSGLAMYVGAVRFALPEIRDMVAEEDSLITKLVTASTGLTGERARHADEGVRQLREQHVYLQRGLRLGEQLVGALTGLLRSLGEGQLDEAGLQSELQRIAEIVKQMDELDEKQELVTAQAKDAFTRLKTTGP